MSIPFVYLRLLVHATLVPVRWERLFDDLEAQLAATDRDEHSAEIADRTRSEVARVQLFDRLREAVGTQVELSVEGVGGLSGVLRRVGEGWLLVDVASRPDVLVTSLGLLAVQGLPVAAIEPSSIGVVESRLDLGHVMRAVARDRAPVTVVLRDGSSFVGTIDRVGADFVDLAEHAADEPRRSGQVTAMRALALHAISLVRTC
jgi:hypothetical protein